MVHPPSPPASATTLRLHRARVKLSTRAQAHGKPHHTHCYTDGKIQCASLPTERTRRIHVQRILDPALLRTAMLNSLFSECPAFPVFLHGFRRWWTDECGSRVSLLLIECLSEFLKVYSNEESCNFFYLKEGILRFQRIFRSREWRFYRGVEAGRGLLIVYESDAMGARIEREIFRYLLLAGSRVFASSRGNHMAIQRLPKNDGIMADCSCLRPGKPVP